MIGNIKIDNKLFELVKNYKKEAVAIVGTGVLIAGIILSSGASKPKEVFPYMPAPTPKIEEKVEVEPQKKTSYITYSVRVAENQIMRLEPRSDGKYIDKIVGNNEVTLLYIDGAYALISYTDSHGMEKLGFVDTERIAHLEDVGPLYQATKLNMYGEIKTNNCRLQNNTDEDYDEPNILTRGKTGEYVKVIGTFIDGKKEWYIVIYRNYIGYMDPYNLSIITEEEFFSRVNTSYVEIVGNKVRFRNNPSLDKGNIITELDRGTRLPIISREADWYYVYYDGKYGYVSTRSDCTKEIFEEYTPPGLTQIHLEQSSNKII